MSEEKEFSREKEKKKNTKHLKFLLRVCVCVCVCVRVYLLQAVLCFTTVGARFHVRIANRVVTGTLCRGGIVNILGGCSRALFVQRNYSTALWRFRARTSNSASGHWRPHSHTHLLCNVYISAQ